MVDRCSNAVVAYAVTCRRGLLTQPAKKCSSMQQFVTATFHRTSARCQALARVMLYNAYASWEHYNHSHVHPLLATKQLYGATIRSALTWAGLMNARRPGVSAALLDEYAAGVSASSSTSTHCGSAMLSLRHAACAARQSVLYWLRQSRQTLHFSCCGWLKWCALLRWVGHLRLSRCATGRWCACTATEGTLTVMWHAQMNGTAVQCRVRFRPECSSQGT
jgi:hypothetical protein